MIGPLHPTVCANFLENKKISRTGFEKFEYISDRDEAHLSRSAVNRCSGLATLESKLVI